MKTVEVQLAAKDKEIQSMNSRFDLMQSQVHRLISSLGDMDQASKNVFARQLYKNGMYDKEHGSEVR